MLRPRCVIKIGSYSFSFVTELSISSSWNMLTDVCEIKIPQRLKKGDETIIAGDNNIFKRGDRVEVEIGYYPNLERVFTGFVSAIKPESPLALVCEDSAFLFKESNITTSYEEVSLSTLMEDLCPIEFETIEANLGAFRISNVNFAQVLKELKKTYGLISFVRDEKLFVGLAYYPEQRVDHSFSFQKNIIEDDLEYRRADDVKVRVKAISILPDNEKIEVQVGDSSGAQRTLTYYDLNEEDLKERAERELPRLKFEGYRGGFLTFGEPLVKHGDSVTLKDLKFPEREGTYLVDGVDVTQGASQGFRQKIKLGPKL